VTLDEALALLSLPRAVGTDPDTGEIITAQNGRYGPYLKRGDDSRSLETEDQIFGVTLDEALRIFAQPKLRRGQVAKPPLRDLGPDPATGLAMVVKDGRFGPYVTDGEINASLRKGDDVETLTVERASELLADRRAAGPAKKRARKGGTRKASKKASKKATTKTAKKATTKTAKKATTKTAKKATKKTAKKAAKKTAKKTTTKTAARSDEETAAPSTAAKAAPAGRRATPEPGV
jgi:DNA topoisomerase-1